jgi:hypothetical protein
MFMMGLALFEMMSLRFLPVSRRMPAQDRNAFDIVRQPLDIGRHVDMG